MCLIWLGAYKFRIAQLTPCPVSLSPAEMINKVTVLDRMHAFPFTVFIPVITDAGGCAASGAGDHD